MLRLLDLIILNNGFRFSSLLLATVECFRQLYAAPPLSRYLWLLCLPFSKLGKVADYKMTSQSVTNAEPVYDFTVKDANGDDVNLSKYKGKVLLIVNVASKCGMTNSNYTELNQLYEKYKDQGLEILAFPCNQFGEEEPGSNEEIKEHVCTRFKSEFPIFAKIDVNGQNASLLYKFLKSGKWGIFGDDIQWNFAKFLVGKNGQVVDRYYPTTSPLSLERDMEKLLSMSC